MSLLAVLTLVALASPPQRQEQRQERAFLLDAGDELVHVLPHGALGRRVLPASRVPVGTPRVWHTRVRICTALHVGDRLITMDAKTVQKVRAAFEEFQHTVFAWTRGRLRIDADIREMDEPLVARDPEGSPFFLTPRDLEDFGVSGIGVESVFLFFPPGDLSLSMLGGTLGADRGPNSAASTGIAWVSRRADAMPRTILHEWLHQLEWLARRSYGMDWLPGPHDCEDLGFSDERQLLCAMLRDYLSPKFLTSATMNGREVVRRMPTGKMYEWSHVVDDPWRTLPLLDGKALARLTGHASLEVRVGRGFVEVTYPGVLPARPRTLDHRLDLADESALLIPVRGDTHRFLVLVRGDLATVYGRLLRMSGVAGVVLPRRPRRRIGIRESGGTATPLLVFGVILNRRPETEVEMLILRDARGSVRLYRPGGVAVVGEPVAFELRREGKVTATLTIDGREAVLKERFEITPATTNPLVLALDWPGVGRLVYRIPVLPKISLELRPRSGPPAIVRTPAPWIVVVRNNASQEQTVSFESWLQKDVKLGGLPQTVRLRVGAEYRLPCEFVVEGDRPTGPADIQLIATTGERSLGRSVGCSIGWARLRVHTAIGRDFMRLGFEDHRRSLRPSGWREVDPGEWTVRIVGRGAAVGRSHLRLSDGGGSRHGRHPLLAPSPLSFDTNQFPYLTFYLRAKKRDDARAALNLQVGEQKVSIPLVGEFVRAWDDCRALSRAEVVLDGAWHRVVYDLDGALDALLGNGQHRVSAIDFGDTRALVSNRYRRTADAWQVDIDEFAVVREPSVLPGPLPAVGRGMGL